LREKRTKWDEPLAASHITEGDRGPSGNGSKEPIGHSDEKNGRKAAIKDTLSRIF